MTLRGLFNLGMSNRKDMLGNFGTKRKYTTGNIILVHEGRGRPEE